ncbi:MAG: hypothetical protein RL712_649 [Bacteroidota bacterium]
MLSNLTIRTFQRLLCLGVLGFAAIRGESQSVRSKIDFNHYPGLRCEGELPSDFKESSVSKAHKAESGRKITGKRTCRSHGIWR